MRPEGGGEISSQSKSTVPAIGWLGNRRPTRVRSFVKEHAFILLVSSCFGLFCVLISVVLLFWRRRTASGWRRFLIGDPYNTGCAWCRAIVCACKMLDDDIPLWVSGGAQSVRKWLIFELRAFQIRRHPVS